MSVQHVVLLGFEPELAPEEAADLVAQVRSWPALIGGLEELRVGPPVTTDRTRGYHYLLYVVVRDLGALKEYQVHPVHRRFSEWVREHGGKVLAFDYVLDTTTVVPAGDVAGAGS